MISCSLCSSSKCTVFKKVNDLIYYLCPQCELIFLDSRFWLSSSEEKSRYLKHQNSMESEGYLSFLSPLADLVLERTKPEDQGLDFGSGPEPVLTKILNQQERCVDSYDPYFAPQKPQQRYDYLIACECVEHFREPEKEFSLLRSLLKENGGKLFVSTLLWLEQEEFANWHYRRDRTHVVFYQKETLNWIKDHYAFKKLEIFSDRLFLLT